MPETIIRQPTEDDARLQRRLDRMGDGFLPSMEYIKRWGYAMDETETPLY